MGEELIKAAGEQWGLAGAVLLFAIGVLGTAVAILFRAIQQCHNGRVDDLSTVVKSNTDAMLQNATAMERHRVLIETLAKDRK